MSKITSAWRSKQGEDAVQLDELDDLITASLMGAGCPQASRPDVSSETASTHAAGPAKRCHVCGKDVAGQKRYKDRHGYWCPDCHKADHRKQHLGTRVRCARCKKSIPESSGFPDIGGVVCSRCQQDAQTEMAHHAHRLAQLAKKAKARRRVWAQLGITLMVIGIVYALIHSGIIGSRSSGAMTAHDFMDGARIVGITFIGMVALLVWWVKRQA